MARRCCMLIAMLAAGVLLVHVPAHGTVLNLGPTGNLDDTLPFFEVWPTSDYDDEAAGKIQNLTDDPMTVTVELKEIGNVGAVAPGFQIVDNTKLLLFTDPAVSSTRRIKARARKRVTRRIRLRALTMGYCPTRLILMVRARQIPPGEVRAMWRPCARLMHLRQHASRKKDSVTFYLGDYGLDTSGYLWSVNAWAVTDVPGSYAIGVPEPATVGCLALGAGALLAARKRRRR